MASRDLEHFRRAFRTGERVTGRVLSRPDAFSAWVDISGYELLARTDTDPRPGTVLTFLIAQLHPVVILREIPRAASDDPGPGPRHIAALLGSFRAARADLDSRLSALGPLPATWDLTLMKTRFLSLLRNDAAAWDAFSHGRRLARDISALPAIRRLGRFLYAPWYPPGASEHELFLGNTGNGGIREILLSFRVDGPGLVRIKALADQGCARCLTSVQYPGRLPETVLFPDSLTVGRQTIRLVSLAGPRTLNPNEPPLLEGLLAPRPGSFTGVNLRV
ncbi:MAG: hypothetical protein ACOY4F_13135 [Thermodesulfobacteriota bacterium]